MVGWCCPAQTDFTSLVCAVTSELLELYFLVNMLRKPFNPSLSFPLPALYDMDLTLGGESTQELEGLYTGSPN